MTSKFMPSCKVIITGNDCSNEDIPTGVDFRFRLPLPLSECCNQLPKDECYKGMITTTTMFSGQVTSQVVLPDGDEVWLVVDIINEDPCGKNKLMDRTAIQVDVPVEEDGVWTEADPFTFRYDTKKKCVDFRGHIRYEAYFVVTNGGSPDLTSNLNIDYLFKAAFLDSSTPVFEIVAFPVSGKCGGPKGGYYGGHHGGYHGGHHGGYYGGKGCLGGHSNCYRGSCGDKRCSLYYSGGRRGDCGKRGWY